MNKSIISLSVLLLGLSNIQANIITKKTEPKTESKKVEQELKSYKASNVNKVFIALGVIIGAILSGGTLKIKNLMRKIGTLNSSLATSNSELTKLKEKPPFTTNPETAADLRNKAYKIYEDFTRFKSEFNQHFSNMQDDYDYHLREIGNEFSTYQALSTKMNSSQKDFEKLQDLIWTL